MEPEAELLFGIPEVMFFSGDGAGGASRLLAAEVLSVRRPCFKETPQLLFFWNSVAWLPEINANPERQRAGATTIEVDQSECRWTAC